MASHARQGACTIGSLVLRCARGVGSGPRRLLFVLLFRFTFTFIALQIS
jgi:hypothetical protein